MTKIKQLEQLIARIPDLAGATVEFKRGQGYYVRVAGSRWVMGDIWFERSEIGISYLTAWIADGHVPPSSRLRQGANPRNASVTSYPTFESAAAWYPNAGAA